MSKTTLWSLIIGFCIVILSALIFFGGGCSSKKPPSEAAVARVMAVQDKYTDSLMKIDGVNGVGTGLDANGRLVIKVTTVRPGVTDIPAVLDSIPVVVEVIGEVKAFMCNGRHRPAPIGSSVLNNNVCGAGTFGCVVSIGSQKYILSNNHVLARENSAAGGEEVVQPGRYDNNPQCDNRLLSDMIAELTDFEPIRFDTINFIDAAVARITGSVSCSTLSKFYGVPGSKIVPAALGLEIKKVGRTTCLTRGTVMDRNFTVAVVYNTGTARFVNQIKTTKGFGKPGDSGSLVVTDDKENNPVGLLFAGVQDGTAFLNPIDLVLNRFNASICGKADSVEQETSIDQWEMSFSNCQDIPNPDVIGKKENLRYFCERTWDCEVEFGPNPRDATITVRDYYENQNTAGDEVFDFLNDLQFVFEVNGLALRNYPESDQERHLIIDESKHLGYREGIMTAETWVAYKIELQFAPDRKTATGTLTIGCIYSQGGFGPTGTCSLELRRK
jgi:hypothetical protein